MIEIINLTKRKTPSLPFKQIKEKILGKNYELSVVLAGDKLMLNLNKTHRRKNKAADTLSFYFSKTEGEIFLNAKENPERILLLFIHSLLHLKGLKHGKKMELEEKDWHNRLKLA